MKTIGIKMKTYAGEVNIVNNGDIERRALGVLLAAFAALALVYVFFLGNMVFNIVERRVLEEQARAVSNEVMDMESVYLSESRSLDLPLSSTMGFKEAKATFAVRKPQKTLGSVAVVNNEI
jgi:hypothetical protein